MGIDMRGHLEYRQSDWWVKLSEWDLIRDYELYRLLANVRGEGALYPPRGVPHDASDETLRDYLLPVIADDEELRRLLPRIPHAISLTEAEQFIAHGGCEWWHRESATFISNPEYRYASWLEAAEFRRVAEHYLVHSPEFLQRRHQTQLVRDRESLGEAEYQRLLAAPAWAPGLESSGWLHPEYRMLLAAMAAGEAHGVEIRLIFWFH